MKPTRVPFVRFHPAFRALAAAAFAFGLGLPSARGEAPAAPPQLETLSVVIQSSLSLQEAFALALKRSETLALRQETLQETEARLRELAAALKPRFSVAADTALTDDFKGDKTATSRTSVALAARQNLFSGFRDIIALQAFRAQGDIDRLTLDRARSLLFQDVAAAYLDLLSRQRELEIRQSISALLQDRLKELEARERIGKTRRSEVIAARTRLAQWEAQIEQVRRDERLSQETLRFLTGFGGDIRAQDIATPAASPLEPYLDRAARRPDVEAARRALFAADLGVLSAKRERWPVVGLEGNLYAVRAGDADRRRWDALVSAELPLYTGGALAARKDRAQSLRRQAELTASLTERQAAREVRAAHQDFLSSLNVFKALQTAERLSQDNTKAQAADYRLGLVDNLDVMDSLTQLLEARLAMDQAHLDAVLSSLLLDVAAGGPK